MSPGTGTKGRYSTPVHYFLMSIVNMRMYFLSYDGSTTAQRKPHLSPYPFSSELSPQEPS